MFTHELLNRFIGYANVSTFELINHMYATYGNISTTDLRNNDAKMNTAYDINLLIETSFNQIEDNITFKEAGQ